MSVTNLVTNKQKGGNIRMKKIISAVLSSTLLLTSSAVFAEKNSNDGYVTYSGTLGKEKTGNFVTISVFDKDVDIKDEKTWEKLNGDKFVYYGEYELSDDLEYSFDFYIGDYTKNGRYTVLISSKTENIEDEISYINSAELKKARNTLSSKLEVSSEEAGNYLKKSDTLKKFGIECGSAGTGLSSSSALAAAEILENVSFDEMTQEETIKAIEKAILAGMIKSGEDIPAECSEFTIANNVFWKYFDKNVKSYIKADSFDSLDEFENEAMKATLLYCVNKSKNAEALEEITTKYKSELGITRKKISSGICNAAVNKGDFDTAEDLVDWINGYKEISGGSGGTESSASSSKDSAGSHSYSGTKLETDVSDKITPSEITAFSDISSVPWAVDAINSLYKLEIINGKGDGLFYPNDSVTREEFIKMLVKAFSMKLVDEEIMFDDVSKDDWSYEYIKTAYISGITKGVSDTLFGKTEKILRQDVCVMIARLFEISGIKAENTELSVQTVFADYGDISEYAKDAILEMYSLGIVSGDENGFVNPKGSTSRAEAAKLLNKAIQIYNEKSSY